MHENSVNKGKIEYNSIHKCIKITTFGGDECMWKLWLALAIILMGFEFVTVSFFLIFFSFGAIAACIVSVFNSNIYLQFIVFAFVSVISIIFAKPFLKKYLNIDGNSRSSAIDAMVGKEGIVTKEISKYGYGQVKVAGETWTAKSVDDSKLSEGQLVKVEGIDGVKLLVVPVETF